MYDVTIVGGGVAGLSAATTLGRSLRSVVVVDDAHPRNAPATSVHNVIGHDGTAPANLLLAGRQEAASYGARFCADRAVGARAAPAGFEVDLAGGERLSSRRLLLATGLVDELPVVPGVAENWGRTVLHCAYCHGFEVRGKRIGVLATSPSSIHQALLFRQLSDRVTFLTNHRNDLDDTDLTSRQIEVVAGGVTRLEGAVGGGLLVHLDDGRERRVDVVALLPRLVARTELWRQLGGSLTNHPSGTYVEAGPMGRTAIPGVWAAGNTADLSAMLAVAAASGVSAAVGINADLVMTDHPQSRQRDRAIERYRATRRHR